MTTQGEPLAARVQKSFLELSEVASDLNSVSDELGKCVSEIDVALKKLNLGISVWVNVNHWEDEHTGIDYYSEQIGYGKIEGKWGLAIRTVRGNYNWPDDEKIESWLFNDGPRKLRLASIEKIPEVLSELSKQSLEMVKNIRGRLNEVKDVAGAVKIAAEATEPEKKRMTEQARGGVKK